MTTDSVLPILLLGLLTVWVLLILFRASADLRERRHVHGGTQPEGNVRRVAKRRLIFWSAAAFFCLTLVLGWLFFGDRPSTFAEWVVSIAFAALKTALFAVFFYATSDYLLNQILPADRRSSAEQERPRE